MVAVNDITMTIGPGVTGLLGPNGAGKTTLLHMIAGFLAAVARRSSRWRGQQLAQPGMFRPVGLVPERDSVYAFLTGEVRRAPPRGCMAWPIPTGPRVARSSCWT